MIQIISTWVILILIYVMVLGSFDFWNLLVGAVISGGLVAAFHGYVSGDQPEELEGQERKRTGGGNLVKRALAFFPFLYSVIKQILTGTWTVALISTGLKPLSTPGIISIPMGERSRSGVLIFGLAISLSPTSILVKLDWEKDEMLFHVIDASNPDQVRKKFDHFYQHYQRPVFP